MMKYSTPIGRLSELIGSLEVLKIDATAQITDDQAIVDKNKYELYGFTKGKGDSAYTIRCKSCQRNSKLCYTHDNIHHITTCEKVRGKLNVTSKHTSS